MTRLLVDPATDFDDPTAVTITATLLDPGPAIVRTFEGVTTDTIVDLPAPDAAQAWRLTVRRPVTTLNRWNIASTNPGPIVEERTVHFGDGDPVAWAALTDVDPGTLQTTAIPSAAWDAAIAELRAEVDNLPTGGGGGGFSGAYADLTGKPITPTSPAPRKTLWQSFQAGHGYALLNGDATSDVNDTADHLLGDQAVKIVTQGTGIAAALYSFGFTPALDLTGKQLALLVKVDNPEHLAQMQLWIGNGTPSPFYVFDVTSYVSNPSNYLEEGRWVWVTLPWTGAASGTPNRATVTAVQLTVNDDNTGQKVTAHVQAIATMPTVTAGAVMFDFDDGFASQEPAIRHLALRGFPCNIYPVGEQVDQGDAGDTTNGPTTTAFLQQAQGLFGALVGCHATTWAAHGTDLGTASAEDAAAFFATNRKWLTDRGLTGADFFAYPGGAYSAQALAYARQHTAAARTVDQRQRETLPPGDPHKLRVLLASPSLTLATFQAEVDAAIAGKYLLDVVFHQVDGTNGPSLAVFKTLVDYCSTRGVDVITAAQALRPPTTVAAVAIVDNGDGTWTAG